MIRTRQERVHDRRQETVGAPNFLPLALKPVRTHQSSERLPVNRIWSSGHDTHVVGSLIEQDIVGGVFALLSNWACGAPSTLPTYNDNHVYLQNLSGSSSSCLVHRNLIGRRTLKVPLAGLDGYLAWGTAGLRESPPQLRTGSCTPLPDISKIPPITPGSGIAVARPGSSKPLIAGCLGRRVPVRPSSHRSYNSTDSIRNAFPPTTWADLTTVT